MRQVLWDGKLPKDERAICVIASASAATLRISLLVCFRVSILLRKKTLGFKRCIPSDCRCFAESERHPFVAYVMKGAFL